MNRTVQVPAVIWEDVTFIIVFLNKSEHLLPLGRTHPLFDARLSARE